MIVSLTIIVASLSFNIGLTHAADLQWETPPINPVQDRIVLPGTTGSDQGQFIQSTFLPTVTKFIIALAGGLSLIFVIIAGIQILTAFGNEESIGAAKKTITWALGGLVISMLSYAIVQAIISIKL